MGSSPTIGTRRFKKPSNLKPFNSANKETLAYIVGVALGDGNLSNPNGRSVKLRVSCDLKYPKLIEKISKAINEILPENKVGRIKHKDANCLDLYCHSNHWNNILGWQVGKGSKFRQRARVPRWIFDKQAYIVKCLCGLIETDGCIYSDRGYKMVTFVSIIPELADDVGIMISILGFQPHRYRIVPRTEYNSQPRYNIRLSKNVQEFLDLVKPEKL